MWRFLRFAWLTLALVFLPACSLPVQTDFPVLPAYEDVRNIESEDPNHSTSNGSENSSSNQKTTITLRVAGPWEAYELDLIGRYFELSTNQVSTLGHEDLGGNHISLDYLKAYDSDLKLMQVPVSGSSRLNDELAREWTAAGNWPDLVLTDHYSPFQASQLLDLLPYLMDNPLLAADKVHAVLLSDSMSPQGLLNLPWRVTVPVLYYNPSAFPDSGSDRWDHVPNWPEFVEHCQRLIQTGKTTGHLMNGETMANLMPTDGSGLSLPEDARLVLAHPEALVSVFPAKEGSPMGWTAWDGSQYDFESPEFEGTMDSLRQLVTDGATLVDDAISFPEYQAMTQMLLENGRVAYQVLDSSQLEAYHSDQANGQVLLLPAMIASSHYPVRIQALSVSKSTGQPALASQIAAFLTADPDALYLQVRLKSRPGLFPIVKDPAVWKVFLDQDNSLADTMDRLPSLLSHSSSGGSFQSVYWNEMQSELTGQAGYRLLAKREIKPVIQALQRDWEQKAR